MQSVNIEDMREREELLTEGGEVQAFRGEVQKNATALKEGG
jgi:hypothetical protein